MMDKRITDEDVEKAVDFLINTAEKAAKYKAERIYLTKKGEVYVN